ncbi:MAG: sel1 repeat family protein [Clostridiales bacterium]|nr:sel1 repeat family protein [Clostridiales bacterium]
MENGYYKQCKEFEECNRLINDYYLKGMYKECFDGHLKLAEKGYPLAECQVGYFYYEGQGVERNLLKSFFWTERAAIHGDRDAQCNLADLFYLNGIVVEKDFDKAKEWFIKAALQGNDYAVQRCKELNIDIYDT